MSLLLHIKTRLENLGLPSELEGDKLKFEKDGKLTTVRLEEGWEDLFKKYQTAKSISFDSTDRILHHNTSLELPLVRLDLDWQKSTPFAYSDQDGNTLTIDHASQIYSFALFDSSEYESYFENLKKRFFNLRIRRVSTIFPRGYSATYTIKGRKIPSDMEARAKITTEKCLLKTAIEQDACFSIWKKTDITPLPNISQVDTEDASIPIASYNANAVSHYITAKSSPFPSQSFLAYYHVLEYFFHRVAEDKLHHQLRTLVNDTKFRSNPDGLDKIISIIRGQDQKNDETELLKGVIERYIPENDIANFVTTFEKAYKDKIYSKKRAIFGENLEISLKEGHTLSNTAKFIKHIRNAIVHSTDRHKRDECHVPLSESENTIETCIPIIRFLAEKVIYGTAE